MINKRIVFAFFILIFCAPMIVYSGGSPQGQPFEYLQRQMEKLTRQLGEFKDRFTPPTIAYELSCSGSILTVDLSITDDKEITYYAIQQQGGDPPINIITFVGPDLASVNYQLTIDPGPGVRSLLFIAVDTEGNSSKRLLEIEPHICSTCSEGNVCPP
jgi:hypothetical protein